MPTSVARSRQNLQLNRYNNVSPNDQHRVILEPYNNNDYINASIARSSSDSVESGQFYILGKYYLHLREPFPRYFYLTFMVFRVLQFI